MEQQKDGRTHASSNGKIVLATVKGDVHDIGKNIVGVVLACNSYDVVDLGVMVPAEKILQAAIAEQADIIGLSGLITPSLDEMCHVAAELERQGFDVPLLIGGATTSRVHTAVKIHPNYRRGQTLYVNDASRAVGVVASLLSRETRARTVNEVRAEYARIAAAHARGEEGKQRLPLADARANALRLNWSGDYRPPGAAGLGHAAACRHSAGRAGRLHRLDAVLRHLGAERQISRHSQRSANRRSRARPVCRCAGYAAANHRRALVQARAVIGLWPANSEGDDILVFADETRTAPIAVLHTLRQQLPRREGRANVALADFIAPRASGLADYVGAFAVTAGLGEEAVVERFKALNDDYSAIMAKALADRLAEALANRPSMRRRPISQYWRVSLRSGVMESVISRKVRVQSPVVWVIASMGFAPRPPWKAPRRARPAARGRRGRWRV